MAVLWRDFLYNLNLKNLGIICSAQQTMRKGGLHRVLSFLLVFFFLEEDICITICRLFSDQMRCAMDWGDLKRAYIKNERIKFKSYFKTQLKYLYEVTFSSLIPFIKKVYHKKKSFLFLKTITFVLFTLKFNL